MNKKCLMSGFVAVILVFAMDFLFHGVLLKATYQASPQLWRSPESMKDFMSYMVFGQVLVGVFFAWIFMKGYRGGGVIEGLRFGLLMGGFDAGKNLIMYTVSPYELSLSLAWIGIALVEGIVVGVALSKVWGTKTCCQA